MNSSLRYINKLIMHPYAKIVFWVLLLTLGSFVFYLRYPFAYNYPNFYAEDGDILYRNIIESGLIRGTLTLFNGYLVVGQYFVLHFASIINEIFGNGFITMPKAIAISSYVYLSAICSLPYVLFQKRMGVAWSILCVIALWLFPLGGWDYVVIGTIGNLKFSFIYVATLLIIYRNDTNLSDSKTKLIITDILLAICVFTNIVVIAILPFALIRYWSNIKTTFKTKQITKVTLDQVSIIILISLSVLYALFVYLKGIPKIPGYLDGPLRFEALIDIVYRSSIYGVIFPLSAGLNDYIVIMMIALLLALFIFKIKHSYVYVTIVFSIFVSVISFVINRPGVTAFYSDYTLDGGPGQYFYAGAMLFVFAVFYASSSFANNCRPFDKYMIIAVILIYISIIFPYAGTRLNTYSDTNSTRPTIYSEAYRVCSQSPTSKYVEFNIFPYDPWSFSVERELLCART